MNNSSDNSTGTALKKGIVDVRNLDLIIGGKRILQNISFTLDEGEMLAIIGKNGCGKTMLLKTLSGIFRPTRGSIKLFNLDLVNSKETDLLELRKRSGYVFQKSGLFDSLTIEENVLFALERFTGKSRQELAPKARELLESTGLKNTEQKFPSELSGGMQKRAGIARAIAMEPDLLLMDDPTAGLDPVLTDAIGELVLSIESKKPVTSILVTHDLKLAYKLAQKIALMHEGKFISIMEIDEFKSSDDPYVHQYKNQLLDGPISVLS